MSLKSSILLNWSPAWFWCKPADALPDNAKHRLGVYPGQAPSPIDTLDVATVIWRAREFSHMDSSSFMPVGLQEKSLTNFV